MTATRHGRARRRISLLSLPLAVGTLVLLTGVGAARATFPGPIDGRIAFVSDRAGGLDIFSMAPDGTDVHNLTNLPAQFHAFDPTWSPAGDRIAYTRRNADKDSFSQIWAMDADGSHQHRVLADPWYRDGTPAYSPDGTRLLFTRCLPDFEECEIFRMNTNGNHVEQLTRWAPDNSAFDPEYSPDGTKIAFDGLGRRGLIAAIWIMNADGSNRRRVATVRLRDGASSGESSYRATLRAAVEGPEARSGVRNRARGGHPVTPPGLEGISPSWSPDGARIAFFSNCCDPKHSAIWAVNADGSGLAHLSHPGPRHDFSPAYAPLGDRIAFERDVRNFSTGAILLMNADGTGVIEIQPDGFQPAWGPAP